MSQPESAIGSEPQIVYEIAEILRAHDDFLIAGHLRPDGDCLGSCLALREMLLNMGKKVRFYTQGPLPDYFAYLPGFDAIESVQPTDYTGPTLCVDSADAERISDTFRLLNLGVNIDHHISNTEYAAVNWIDPEATAAG
jgi:phosphoesterase RecJ-like protein